MMKPMMSSCLVLSLAMVSYLLIHFASIPSIQGVVAKPLINNNNLANNRIVIKENDSSLIVSKTAQGSIKLPDQTVIDPGNSGPVLYECKKSVGQEHGKCTSEIGNVADAMMLNQDKDKVCSGGLSCSKTQCECDMK